MRPDKQMDQAATFKQATRVHTSLLANVEKSALIWIAGRLPSWVNSDHLTALGFFSMLAAGACYWYSPASPAAGLLLVNLFLVLNWFGDSLDGTLARVRNQQRPRYGFYLDHILDAIGTVALLGGLALSGFMSERIVLLLIISYFLLSIEVYLATYTVGRFKMSHGRFGPTELRLLLIVGNLFLLRSPFAVILGQKFLLFDVGGAVGIAGIVFMLARAVWRNGSQLYREETLP
jgi:phosphatidylglycerophosphate synthase